MRFLPLVVLATLAVPAALADEAAPACEPDSLPHLHWLRDAHWAADEATKGTGASQRNCEGEHWDGQDPLAPSRPAACDAPYANLDAREADACMGADPNANREVPTQPARARASTASGPASREAYASADLLLVGRVAFYVGHCTDGGTLAESGVCGPGQRWRFALYARDNTPGNLLWSTVHAPGVYRGYAAEGDCTHAGHMRDQQTNQRPMCGRDNTAVTLDLVLP